MYFGFDLGLKNSMEMSHLCWFITLVPDMAMDKYLPNNPKEEEILAPVLSVTVIHPTIPLKDLDVAPFIVIGSRPSAKLLF